MKNIYDLSALKKKQRQRRKRGRQLWSFLLFTFLIFSEGVQCQEPGEQGIKILVAATRKYAITKEYPKGWFLGQRGSGLSYGELFLYPPKTNALKRMLSLGKDSWIVKDLYVPVTQNAARDFTEAAFGHDILLYVHGYRETFESAAKSALQLSRDIQFQGMVGLFTWPSAGTTFEYGYDRESAIWSREFFAQLLRALEHSKSGGRVHIVAHSMGTLLTLEALRDVRLENGDQALTRIGAIVLASPDVDMDIFQQALERLGPEAKRITVITANNDRALALSSILAGGVDRAGTANRDRLEKLGVRVADASEFGEGMFNHDLFLTIPDVIQVVRRAIDRAR